MHITALKTISFWRRLLPVVPLLISIVIGWNWTLIADDGLITHRYVNNFLTLGEPYYNPGDRVLGLTSPGYFLLLSGIASVTSVIVGYKLIAAVAYLIVGMSFQMLDTQRSITRRLAITTIFAANLHLTFWFCR